MAKFPVQIFQSFRVERTIVIEVEAASAEAAVEMQEEADAPAFDDARWKSEWSLQNEEVTISHDSCPTCDGRGTTTFHNSETGATRTGVCPSCLDLNQQPARNCTMTKIAYVHAWEYCNGTDAGGGGFEWYHQPDHADGAFGDDGDVRPNEAHFRFDFETEETDADAITAAIDGELIALCAAATVRKVGPVLLAYWQAGNMKMGTATEAAS